MITRRNALTSSLAVAGLMAETASAAPAAAPAPHNILKRGAEVMRGGVLMNLPRAYQVMEQEGLDGLVLASALNVYHLTGYWDHMTIRYDSPFSIVLLSRDPRQAPGLVMSQFLYYFSFSDAPNEAPLQTFLFTNWDGQVAAMTAATRQPDAEIKVAPTTTFTDMHLTPVTAIEQRRLNRLDAALTRPMDASPERALAKAARAMGLDRGRIGYDHAIVPASYEMAGLPATLVQAEQTLRRIRMVKSPREIELMRLTATANAEAALAAVKIVRAGASHRDLREAFYTECGKRGTTPLFMQIDTVMPETYDATFKDGTMFMIDSVSLGFHYTGDFGRTIFVGEPTKPMKRAADCMAFGWDAVREHLKPGVTYSEIRNVGNEAIKKAGYEFTVPFNAHSVGLMHTDEPAAKSASGFFAKDDIRLEESMIISVDCPVMQVGMGGTGHLEDLTLITKDVAVQINDIAHRTVMV